MALTAHMSHVCPTILPMIGLTIGLTMFRPLLDLLMPPYSFDFLSWLHIAHLKRAVVIILVRVLDVGRLCYCATPTSFFYFSITDYHVLCIRASDEF
jgi:hypothetical protein